MLDDQVDIIGERTRYSSFALRRKYTTSLSEQALHNPVNPHLIFFVLVLFLFLFFFLTAYPCSLMLIFCLSRFCSSFIRLIPAYPGSPTTHRSTQHKTRHSPAFPVDTSLTSSSSLPCVFDDRRDPGSSMSSPCGHPDAHRLNSACHSATVIVSIPRKFDTSKNGRAMYPKAQ